MPAAMHMAGHHTQWKRMISLPIRWWTAGHQASKRSLVLAVADGGQVVDERVVPDVEDVLLVPGDRHPPVDRRPGDGDVPQATLDEAQGLVALGLGHHRARVGLVPVDEPVLEGAQAEEVVLLLEVLDRSAVDRAQGRRRAVRPRRSTARRARSRGRGRCPCRCSRSRGCGQELLDGPVVAGLGGADEVVVGDVELGPGRRRTGGPAGRSTPAGSSACSSAARATFWPCSSVPVRKKTSSPISRCQRARASALTVV